MDVVYDLLYDELLRFGDNKLTTQLYSALLKNGISTIEEFYETDLGEYKKMKGIGPACINRIHEMKIAYRSVKHEKRMERIELTLKGIDAAINWLETQAEESEKPEMYTLAAKQLIRLKRNKYSF